MNIFDSLYMWKCTEIESSNKCIYCQKSINIKLKQEGVTLNGKVTWHNCIKVLCRISINLSSAMMVCFLAAWFNYTPFTRIESDNHPLFVL